MTGRRRVSPDDSLEAVVRLLHGWGWSDGEIAEHWAVDHPVIPKRTIRDYRADLGLGSNAHSERQRRRIAAKTREQLAAAGVRSLADVRAASYRQFAAERGWPDYLRPRHVQILDHLYTVGPQTREEIACAIGWNLQRGQRAFFACVYGRGSYLADLLAAGFVGRSEHRHVRRGRTCLYTYFVRPEIERNRPDTWPEKEGALGRIYGEKSKPDFGTAADSAGFGGTHVPGKVESGGCQASPDGGPRRDRQRHRRARKTR